MGESDRYGDYRYHRNRVLLGQDNNALMALFVLNVLFFLLLLFIKVVYNYFQSDEALYYTQVVAYFELPARLIKLSERPWTLLTYMFSDISLLSAISNMIWLWAFGYIMQQLTGNKKIFPVFIYGGLAGGLFFIIANYSIPALKAQIDSASLLGANAGTMAIATAVATLAPDYRIFRSIRNGMPIWILTLLYIALDLINATSLMKAPHCAAHLGGALAGFLFVYLLRKGWDGSAWMNTFYNWFINLFNPGKKGHTSIKQKVFYITDGRSPFKKNPNITQQRVDEILDKINQQGYHLLTDEEKNILKKASEEDL